MSLVNRIQNLPGFTKNERGNLAFELTKEEIKEAQWYFSTMGFYSDPQGELYANPELTTGLYALALSYQAQRERRLAEIDSGIDEKKEFIEKAISLTVKSYSLCPLPIYIYNLACLLEMNGDAQNAKDAFESFLQLQKNFKFDSEIKDMLLGIQLLRSQPLEEAVEDAKKQLETASK